MSFIRGKNIIFGESFVFEIETETNIVSDNSLPIEQVATVFDDLHIKIDKIMDYISEDNTLSDYNKMSDNISNVFLHSCGIPVKTKIDDGVLDYISEDNTLSDYNKMSDNISNVSSDNSVLPVVSNINDITMDYISEDMTYTNEAI